MDRSSLIVTVMPIATLISLFTGVALPFIVFFFFFFCRWHAQMS